MPAAEYPCLREVLSRHSGSIGDTRPEQLLRLYARAIPLLEAELWTANTDQPSLNLYQGLFREREALIASMGADKRHRFVVVIPVADRPRQLRNCLNSLLDLCRAFQYGGLGDDRRYAKVSVLIADDSADPANIAENRALAEHSTQQGLNTEYFGLSEQHALVSSLGEQERQDLTHILGPDQGMAAGHKGASLIRNITYLRLSQIARTGEKLLFHFVDSDQEFRVKVNLSGRDQPLLALNYFHYLDAIFGHTDAWVLTGKVVGDPPVSPAVMAGTLLHDVIGFLERMAHAAPDAPCQFHGEPQRRDDAAYHDMAGLFGFTTPVAPFDYPCPIDGMHDHRACFTRFAASLERFFHGEHPTRSSHYEYQHALSSVAPARTVYTGNYVLAPAGLRYFVPFATLKLRMAGPALGRIVRARVRRSFVAANLPMLHGRTVADTGEAEFRPGVDREEDKVDLSAEFERQFFGDVLLFSVETLTAMGYPARQIETEAIARLVGARLEDLRDRYQAKHRQILARLGSLQATLNNPLAWWNHTGDFDQPREQFDRFVANMQHNFGEDAAGYRLIAPGSNSERRQEEIIAAIAGYEDDRRAWGQVLARSLDR